MQATDKVKKTKKYSCRKEGRKSQRIKIKRRKEKTEEKCYFPDLGNLALRYSFNLHKARSPKIGQQAKK